jgi:hypothetical protein
MSTTPNPLVDRPRGSGQSASPVNPHSAVITGENVGCSGVGLGAKASSGVIDITGSVAANTGSGITADHRAYVGGGGVGGNGGQGGDGARVRVDAKHVGAGEKAAPLEGDGGCPIFTFELSAPASFDFELLDATRVDARPKQDSDDEKQKHSDIGSAETAAAAAHDDAGDHAADDEAADAPAKQLTRVVNGEENEDRVGQWSAALYKEIERSGSKNIEINVSGNNVNVRDVLNSNSQNTEINVSSNDVNVSNVTGGTCVKEWGNIGGSGTLRLLTDKIRGISRLVFRDRFMKQVRFNRTIHPQDKMDLELDGGALKEIAEHALRPNFDPHGCTITSWDSSMRSERVAWVFESAADYTRFTDLWKSAYQSNSRIIRAKCQTANSQCKSATIIHTNETATSAPATSNVFGASVNVSPSEVATIVAPLIAMSPTPTSSLAGVSVNVSLPDILARQPLAKLANLSIHDSAIHSLAATATAAQSADK